MEHSVVVQSVFEPAFPPSVWSTWWGILGELEGETGLKRGQMEKASCEAGNRHEVQQKRASYAPDNEISEVIAWTSLMVLSML